MFAYNGFYKELDNIKKQWWALSNESFCFLEEIEISEAMNLYDFLHGSCGDFATGLSDFYGYEVEYVVNNIDVLVHVYCVAEIGGVKAYIDARGITTDSTLFFKEFAGGFCECKNGALWDRFGECKIYNYKDTRELYNDNMRELNQDKDLVEFFKDNNAYYDVKVFEKEFKMKTLKDWPEGQTITQYLRAGDKVDNAMYEHFLNIMPPNYHFGGVLQVGGACDAVKNEDGVLKNTYLTFVRDNESDCWIFKGECFSREWINRNPELDPPNEKFKNAILYQLESKGFDVSQIELNIIQFIDDHHKNCVWYDGTVATIVYKNQSFSLVANGEVKFTVGENVNAFDLLENDAHLTRLNEQGQIKWDSNNWFELCVETSDNTLNDLNVCDSVDLEECIFEMVENIKGFVEEFGQNDIDKLIDNAKNISKETNKDIFSKDGVEFEKE